MPEGDTIFRAARTLDRALAGKPVVRFESVLPALTRIDDDHPVSGRTVERVRSLGKHLLMQFSGDLVLRTHMRMNGSWHIYRPGETWHRSRQDMRVVVADGGLRRSRLQHSGGGVPDRTGSWRATTSCAVSDPTCSARRSIRPPRWHEPVSGRPWRSATRC